MGYGHAHSLTSWKRWNYVWDGRTFGPFHSKKASLSAAARAGHADPQLLYLAPPRAHRLGAWVVTLLSLALDQLQ